MFGGTVRTYEDVFNPLSVYYAFGRDGTPRLLVYEVSNTFGQHKTYVLPVEPPKFGPIRQNCAKRLYVSPFNEAEGRYDFESLKAIDLQQPP